MSKAPAKHINFMAPRKVLGILSIALVVISIALLATRGLNLGLDFTGGTSVVVKSEQDLDLDQVRGAVAERGFSDAIVQQYGSAREVSIRVAPTEGVEADQVGGMVFEAVNAEIDNLELLKVEFVGPQVGDELRDQSG
ncbi:MAG TPA: protein translocase subunit SecF, partial [Alcanivorax sp.]|nr:protein translocase subunit SecF [Alcanivorax sp.]